MDLLRLENDQLIVEVDALGAQLMRLYSKRHDHEYIWINDDKIWNRRAPVLFPIVGELKNGSYLWKNKEYKMGRHGFARDMKFEQISTKEEGLLRLRLSDDENTRSIYPFSFLFEIDFRVEGNTLRQYFRVKNTSNGDMPFSVGGHPAFTADPIEKCRLVFETNEDADAQLIDSNGLVTDQKTRSIKSGVLELNKNTFDRDALIFSGLKSRWCELQHASSERILRFDFGNFPMLGIWSKPNAPFVCIEPWQGVADHTDATGKLKDKIGVVILPPKGTFQTSFLMECR